MEGDDEEEDVDDIEHEFNIDDEKNKHGHAAEAMLHGKMSYGRGPEDDENSQFPIPVISGGRSRPVRFHSNIFLYINLFSYSYKISFMHGYRLVASSQYHLMVMRSRCLLHCINECIHIQCLNLVSGALFISSTETFFLMNLYAAP